MFLGTLGVSQMKWPDKRLHLTIQLFNYSTIQNFSAVGHSSPWKETFINEQEFIQVTCFTFMEEFTKPGSLMLMKVYWNTAIN